MEILFNQIVFGPIKSRRFGISLGINLLPLTNKVCNFNCIYCECGWTDLKNNTEKTFNKYDDVINEVEKTFIEYKTNNTHIDAITFAGNGEPTMHPMFEEIIDKVIFLRNNYFPKVKIVVLSNSAFLNKKKVVSALKKVDLRVLKLDAGSNNMFEKINMPLSSKKVDWYVSKLKEFNGDLIIQTIFLKGKHNNEIIDNTQDNEVDLWLKEIKDINPKSVMIYTIDRDTPAKGLEKIPIEKLNLIAEKVKQLGIDATVY